jgi:hypothetical protein
MNTGAPFRIKLRTRILLELLYNSKAVCSWCKIPQGRRSTPSTSVTRASGAVPARLQFAGDQSVCGIGGIILTEGALDSVCVGRRRLSGM